MSMEKAKIVFQLALTSFQIIVIKRESWGKPQESHLDQRDRVNDFLGSERDPGCLNRYACRQFVTVVTGKELFFVVIE